MNKKKEYAKAAEYFCKSGEFSPSLTESFLAGAAFAEDRLIYKALEWFWNNFYEHPHERWLICSESFDTIEYMIERFKAEMEE